MAASALPKSDPRPTSVTEDVGQTSQTAAIIPPYWQHRRAISQASVASNGRPAAIILEDNTEQLEGIRSPLWAKVVEISSYTVVSGNVKGLGDYVVWSCKVETLDGGDMIIRKRFSEFETLRSQLASTFPRSKSALPDLPPKSVFYKFRPSFLEHRRAKLEYFLNCVLLNPEFSSSAILKEFVFS